MSPSLLLQGGNKVLFTHYPMIHIRMSKLPRFLSGTVFATILVLGGTALPAHAAGLNSQQISSIIGLLQSFGADQSVINSVQVALGGTPSTTTNSCYTFSTNLRVGMSGSAVTALQTALKKDGESVSITNTFDDQTASAVSGFQQKYASIILTPNGLQYGTGYVGAATRNELSSLCAQSGQQTIQPTPIVIPVPAPQPTVPPTNPNPISSGQMQTYSNAQYGFSFQYPSDFSTTASSLLNHEKVTATGQQVYGSTSPAPQVLVEASIDPSTVSTCNTIDLGSLASTGSASLISVGVNVTPVLGTQTIGGVQFRSASVAEDLKGSFMSFTLYAALHNGVCYVIATGLEGKDPSTQNQLQSVSPVVLPAAAANIAAEENTMLQSLNFSSPTASVQSGLVSTTSTTSNPSVSFITPGSGQSIAIGSTYQITWQASGAIPSNAYLEFSLVGVDGKTYGIPSQPLIPSQGSYSWQVIGPVCTPDPNYPGTQTCSATLNPGQYQLIAQMYSTIVNGEPTGVITLATSSWLTLTGNASSNVDPLKG
jgi:hypothetical protein